MARFHLSKAATRDLREIIAYIRHRSPKAAKRVKTEIRAEIVKISEMPHRGHVREDIGDNSLRVWSKYSYLIIYEPENKPIEIVRIVHGAQNLGRFFKDA